MLRKGSLAVLVAAIAALAPAAARAQWLTYGRDYSHSGIVEEPIPAPLAVLWKFASRPYYGLQSGASPTVNTGSPIIVGDTVYFASRDRLYAIDRTSGEMKWRYPSGTDLAPTIRSTPVYSDGMLFVGAMDGDVYAVDADTGSHRWVFRTMGPIRSHPIVVKTTADDPGLLIFGSDDGSLNALDPRTGQLRWKNTDSKGDIASALAYSADSGLVYYASADNQVHAVDVSAGKQRWAARMPMIPASASPVLYDQRLYLPAGTSIYRFSLRNGTQSVIPFIGQHQLEADITCTPIVTPDPQGSGGPSSGLLYFGDHNGNFYCATFKGEIRWKKRLDAPVTAMPILVGDTIYAGSQKGFVYAMSAADGLTRWAYRTEAPRDYNVRYSYHNISAPLVADHGQLLVLGDDGTLNCFTPSAIDASAPMIAAPKPDRSATMNGTPPITISAYLWDEGSGINPATVALYLDGQALEASPDPYYVRGSHTKSGLVYDPIKRQVEYSTLAGRTGERAEPLRDGRHTVKVEATDWKGNVGSLEWSFMVDNRLPVRRRPTNPANQPGRGPGYSGGYSGGMSSGGMPNSGGSAPGSSRRPGSTGTRTGPASRRGR